MEQLVNDSLLLRFLKKETSEQENAEILHWVSGSEENCEEFRRVHRIFHLSMRKHYESEIDIDQAWNKLISQIPEMKGQSRSLKTDASIKQGQSPTWPDFPGRGRSQIQLNFAGRKEQLLKAKAFWKVAASVAIILAVGFGSLWTYEHFFYRLQTAKVRIESPAGEKSKVVLADGTLVWLNSQTILDYNASDPRKVTLGGEAYFDVAKDHEHPFEVTTASGLKVTVLGTRFNLRSFSGENRVEATLEEGEIVITGIDYKQPVRLVSGQQASYNVSNRELQIRNVSSPGIYSSWKNNELRFTDISFRELVPCIERWYGVKIDLDPRISKTDRFTMTIKTESLRELLNMMQLTSKFNYEINGEKVTIRPIVR
jgi:transmembrane sensor